MLLYEPGAPNVLLLAIILVEHRGLDRREGHL
jgi:hypothetical protein